MSSLDATEGRAPGTGEASSAQVAGAKTAVNAAAGPPMGTAPGVLLPLERLSLACGPTARLKGLLVQEERGGALLLAPCRDVHTFGMRRRIDIAFADSAGRVLEAHRFVEPRRRLRCKGAAAVVERFSTTGSPWFVAGDSLELTCDRAAHDAYGGVEPCASCSCEAETSGCAGTKPCVICTEFALQLQCSGALKAGVAQVRAHMDGRTGDGKESA